MTPRISPPKLRRPETRSPETRSPETRPAAPGPSATGPDGCQAAIIIDDSPSALRQMLHFLAAITGCRAMGFTNSAQALAWCLAHTIDLVVVDYTMPPPNGLAFIEALRRDPTKDDVAVVMVTSSADKDIRYQALQLGATDFLTKPIDPIEFVARLQNLLASCRAHRALAAQSQGLAKAVVTAQANEAIGRQRLHTVSMVVEQSPVSVIITNRTGIVEYVNHKFTEASGFSPEEVIGLPHSQLQSGFADPEHSAELWATITAGRDWRGVLHSTRKDGSRFWESALISPIRDADGVISKFVAIKEDITLRRTYEERLDWQANYDTLTGLPNRMLALDRLSHAIAQAQRQGRQVAVMVVDINRFKQYQATLGHAVADDLLCQIARRLQDAAHNFDVVARVGVEEFLLVLSDIGNTRLPHLEAARMCDKLAAPFSVDGAELFVSASVGITIHPADGSAPHELLRNAHAAMQQAQTEGQGAWRFFTAENDVIARRRLLIESHLRHALDRNEFAVHYQPLVALASGAVPAAEALLRWTSPELGTVPPDQFIPIAEETGMISAIGAWVLETVCRDLALWEAHGLMALRVAVNVSSRQLTDATLVGIITQALADNGLAGDRLELEVTERLLLDTTPLTLSTLGTLRALGLRFSIDDFGTGYSSMSYLTAFPFDVLKIDRSFVSHVTERPQDAALTRAIIAMARSLGLDVVAEGVETEEQLAFLCQNGCDLAQGYLFAHPAPAATFAAGLATSTPYRTQLII